MRTIFYCSLISFLCICVGCSKLELPDEADDKDDTENVPDTSKPDDEYEGETVYSVADFMKMAKLDEQVTVQGYIVGYVEGNTIENTFFGTEKAVASNIVLADSPNETKSAKCLPVQLGTAYGIRKELNLQQNPQMLGKFVLLQGDAKQYMKTKGVKNVCHFEIKDASNDTPSQPSAEYLTFPIMENEPPLVFEGD